MSSIVLIRRNDALSPHILYDGEIAFVRNDREFYIGDGKTPMTELTPFNSLVAGEDGKIYAVRVDKNGNAHAKPVICYAGNRILEFKIEE